MSGFRRRPNTRVQRTRSSPSVPHAPLTRRPLGATRLKGAAWAAICALCVVHVNCASTRAASPDDLSVLTAVVQDTYLFQAALMEEGVVLDRLSTLSPLVPWAHDPSSECWLIDSHTNANFIASRDLLESAIARNREPVRLELALPGKYSSPETGHGRIVRLSLPGYSRDGHDALVSVERDYHAPCCPEGYTVYLEQRSGVWVVVAHGAFWIV